MSDYLPSLESDCEDDVCGKYDDKITRDSNADKKFYQMANQLAQNNESMKNFMRDQMSVKKV